MKSAAKKGNRLRSALVLGLILAAGLGLFLAAHPADTEDAVMPSEYMEYEQAAVDQILTDSTEKDPVSENHHRGSQNIIVTVLTGRYAGKQMMADNTVGPVYGNPVSVGDKLTVGISTYADGTVRCYVYEYDRSGGLALMLGLFFLVTVLVGGKVGAKSLVGLSLTVVALIWILLPLLLQELLQLRERRLRERIPYSFRLRYR